MINRWLRSTRCDTNACVEVQAHENGQDVMVRSSRVLSSTLVFTIEEWDQFIAGVKAGEFDAKALLEAHK